LLFSSLPLCLQRKKIEICRLQSKPTNQITREGVTKTITVSIKSVSYLMFEGRWESMGMEVILWP